MSVRTDHEAGGVNGDGGEEGAGELTLVFALSAIRQFAEPATVFADAREWSRYVGVVANDTVAVTSFVEEHGLQQDFELGDRDKWLAMQSIREATATPRHVFVGTSADDRRIADHLDWEYRTVLEVAEKAGWRLAKDASDASTGLSTRLRDWLDRASWWPFGQRKG